jgi:hypothetical protein
MQHFLLLLFIFVLKTPVFAKDFAGGSGTETDPYLITTSQEFSNLRKYLGCEHHSKYFKMTNDINVSEFSNTAWENHCWEPIGNLQSPFCSHLDGDGHTISGILISNKQMSYCGLFGVIGAEGTCTGYVCNLNIGCYIDGYNMCGGLAGFMVGGTQIYNCTVEGYIFGNSYLGGLIGSGKGTINNCHVKDICISGKNSYIGGLIGSGGGSITNSSVYSQLGINGGGNYIGGLIGYCDYLSMKSS